MHVLHVISSLHRQHGGPVAAIVGLAGAQVAAGLRVKVFSTFSADAQPDAAEELRERGVDVELLGPCTWPLGRHPKLAAAVGRSVAQADVVHIHALWEEVQHQAARAARRGGVPYLIRPCGMLDPWSLSQSPLRKKLYLAWRMRRVLNCAEAIHFTTPMEAELARPLNLRAPSVIEPNGVDLAEFETLLPPDAFRDRYPRLQNRPLVIFLSRIHKKKGLDLLIPALAQLKSTGATLVLAGPDDEGYGAVVHRLIAEHGLKDQVVITGMLVGRERVAALAAADLFVLPSYTENFGIAVIEALAAGTPVVISDRVNIHPEINEAGAGGVVPLSIAALAAELKRWLADDTLRRSAGEHGRKLVRERYDWRRIARRWATHYERLKSGTSSRSHGPGTNGNGKTPPGGRRPSLAVIANTNTPYRTHLHRRIARELPELELHSIFTHEMGSADWSLTAPAEINPHLFGRGESSRNQGSLPSAPAEWRKGGRIIEWLAARRIDAVVCNGYNDVGRLRIISWCHRHGVPVFLWGDSNVRADRAAGMKLLVKRLLLRNLMRWTDGVLCCGSLGRAYFERYGAPPEQILYSPYEPDYELIQRVDVNDVEAVRQRFGMRRGRRHVVFSGRLVQSKRPDLLIEAFIAIAEQRPQWDVVLIGDGPLRAALQARVPNSLRERVVWTGFLPHQQDVSAVYRASDVLVLPSDTEPWALVINEAAAAGLAIVASSAVGAAAELVWENVNGLVFPPGDLPALVDALLAVTDPERIDLLKAGSASVLENWRRRADPVEGLRRALESVGLSDQGRLPTR